LRVVGSSDDWYRVALPDGTRGFVQAQQTEEAVNPLRSMLLTAGQSVHDRPSLSAPTIDSLDVASEVPVFGEFGDFVGVLSPSGRPGWIAMD
jgi:hypothetical protein